MKTGWMLIALLALGLPFAAGADDAPTSQQLGWIRACLVEGRRVLEDPKSELDPADREKLIDLLGRTEGAFKLYLEKSERLKEAEAAAAPLYAAGGFLLADDLSGAGLADDVLLPLVAVGILVSGSKASPGAKADLLVLWAMVQVSAQALSVAASQAAAKKPGCACKCLFKKLGPSPQPRQPYPKACESLCRSEKVKAQGYQCGSVVGWFN